MKKILILEEDDYIRDFAAGALSRAGFVPVEAASVSDAVEQLSNHDDLGGAVLDVAVSQGDVTEVCQNIRMDRPELAILMLASRAEQSDAITGLMTGADETLSKPFSAHQLTMAVEALLGRTRTEEIEEGQLLSSGPFILDTKAFTLEKLGRNVALTRPEYSMLKLFLENPGKALSREEIFQSVWGREEEPDLKNVEDRVRRLRLKLEEDPSKPVYITTVWGYGYQWNN